MSADPHLLMHALRRAGIDATSDADPDHPVVHLHLPQKAADDLAERLLRTVPLSGPEPRWTLP